MKKLIAIATVVGLVFATPAMAGGFGQSYGGNSGSLVNVNASNMDVLNGAQFLNGIYIGNNASVLSGILSGNAVANGNSIPVLNGSSVPVLSGNNTSVLSVLGLSSPKKAGRW